jgi:hypothetical protein
MYNSPILTSARSGGKCQLYPPGVLLAGYSSRYTPDRILDEPQGQSGLCDERKICCLCRESNSCRPARSLTAISTKQKKSVQENVYKTLNRNSPIRGYQDSREIVTLSWRCTPALRSVQGTKRTGYILHVVRVFATEEGPQRRRILIERWSARDMIGPTGKMRNSSSSDSVKCVSHSLWRIYVTGQNRFPVSTYAGRIFVEH